MLYLSIGLFALSAVLGLTILLKWMSSKDAPKGVIYSHGLFAATALVLLIVYGLNHPEHFPTTSLILFVLSALGGFFMFFRDLKKKEPIIPVAFVHGALAVGGFITLLYFAMA